MYTLASFVIAWYDEIILFGPIARMYVYSGKLVLDMILWKVYHVDIWIIHKQRK